MNVPSSMLGEVSLVGLAEGSVANLHAVA